MAATYAALILADEGIEITVSHFLFHLHSPLANPSEFVWDGAARRVSSMRIDSQGEKIHSLTTAAKVDVEPIWATLLAKALDGKDVKAMLTNVGGGGAPAAAAASGGAAAAAGGDAAPAEEAKEEKEEEAKEESDEDMVSTAIHRCHPWYAGSWIRALVFSTKPTLHRLANPFRSVRIYSTHASACRSITFANNNSRCVYCGRHHSLRDTCINVIVVIHPHIDIRVTGHLKSYSYRTRTPPNYPPQYLEPIVNLLRPLDCTGVTAGVNSSTGV